VDLVTEQDLLTERSLLDETPEPEPVLGRDPAAEHEGTGLDRPRACHEMLLRVAGRAPDGLLTRSRDWLAHGELGHLARAVAYWAVSQDVTLAETDAALLAALLTEADQDASAISQLTLEDFDPYPFYGFGPQIPPELGGGAEGTPDPAAQPGTPADQVAVEAVTAEPGVIGLWRAWRFPADGAPWPPPKRVFVVEGADIDEPGLAARMAERLTAAGEADPQVEVFRSGFQLPVYQELARSYGELLCAAAPDPGVQLAAIFDEVDADTGPSFRPDHEVLAETEADKVMQYLYGGEPLLVTAALMDDVMDSTRVSCVPMSFRTDGVWVWNEAAAYYADEYQLVPEPGLLAHVRASDYLPPAVDGVGVYRALQALENSAGDEVMWMFGSGLDDDGLEPEETGVDADLELAAGAGLELAAGEEAL
jgi:hypothetical protein